jgi:type IV secretory pathway TrbL component
MNLIKKEDVFNVEPKKKSTDLLSQQIWGLISFTLFIGVVGWIVDNFK